MKLKVFYSWQSQTDQSYNRFFIKACLEKALQRLNTIPETADISYHLIDSTMEEPGTPSVADKIIKEIIPSVDIFIADISVVNQIGFFSQLFKPKNYRPSVNQNVLIEFSTAMSELGNQRVIHIMNNQYGTPEGLPFDIHHLKYPVTYIANSRKSLLDAEENLIDSLTKKLKLCSEFCLQFYRNRFSPLKAWSNWESIISNNTYISNAKIAELAENIYKSADQPGSIMRLVGLSGLGKTRILFELFRPMDDLLSKKRSGRVLFYDCNDGTDFSIKEIIERVIEEKNEYILILDNCPPDFCRRLKPNIQSADSKVSLIAIDNNPEELSSKIDGVIYLSLDKKDLSDVVEHIVKTDFPEMKEDQIKKIHEFSQGIPLMAVLLGESIRNGEKFVGRLEDKDLLDKLLGKFAEDKEVRTLLQSSALFMNFGHEEELEPQFDFIATNRDLTVTDNSEAVSKKLFRQIINHYIDRQIFEKKGRTIGMRPFPLSIYLTREWLDTVSSQTVINLLNAIAALGQPHQKNLSEAIAEQMRHLGYDNNARTIIEKITGHGSPFGSAEVLNTELGSRLFRAFVEVNPETIADTLDRIFSSLSDDDIKLMVKGRRNLVTVLEKLCFNYSTFQQGAKLLFRFAIAENETWANNATGQFLHLFNIMLAGTEAKPVDKINIIDWGLTQKSSSYQDLSIKAMGNALNYGSFVRMGGAEVQGSRSLEDYRPYKKEVYDYWQYVLNNLLSIIINNDDKRELAYEALIPKLRNLVRADFPDLLSNNIEPLLKVSGDKTDNILQQLKLILKYDANHLTDNVENYIKDLITKYKKDDFYSKYKRMIKNYQFDYSEDHSQERVNKEIEGLAQLFIESDLDWYASIPAFFEHSQYGVNIFGRSLAKQLIKNNLLTRFIESTSEVLLNKSRNEVNLSLLGGIASEAGEDYADEIEQFFINKNGQEYILFYLRSLRHASFEKTNDLFELVNTNQASIEEFENFAYNGRFTNDLEKVKTFVKRIEKYGRAGNIIAFKTLFNISFQEEASRDKVLPLLRNCILTIGTIHTDHEIDEYQWWETIKHILTINEDNEFARSVNRNIIESIDWKNSYHLDHYVQEVYVVMLKKYFDIIWPDLSTNLISTGENYIKFFGLKHILGSSIGGVRRSIGVLFDGNIEKIFEWANLNQPLAPSRLAELVPIFGTKIRDENIVWHPAAAKLLNQFGENMDVLNNLDTNLGSFSWTGSVVPYYEAQLKLMKLIDDHPIASVAKWANEKIKSLKIQISAEKNRDAEWDIR
ncbi:hypothetical protein ACS5PU_15175 [Pedobacter sp. GSP4]|uniref:hypothetical protein n=1 Tax=Pedobacter sp. GSP4 TaxID=3453716 RepID=UPI003EEDF277